MKITLTLSLSLLTTWSLAAESVPRHDGAELSLGEISRTVLERNPAIKEARQKWEALKARVPQAAAWADPRISAESVTARFVNIPANAFTDQRLSFEQELPLIGKNRSRKRIATAEAITAFEEARRQELNVLAQTRATYFRLADAWAQLELNRRNIVSLQQIAGISRAKYEVGTETAAGALVAETEVSKLSENARDLEQKIAASQSTLNVLMNRDAFAPLDQPTERALPAAAFSTDRLRKQTLENRPEIRMAAAKLAAEKSRLELARREWIPDPAVSVQASRYNDTGQAVSEVGAGLSFSVPWTNYRKYSAIVREAENNLGAASAALDRTQKESIGLLRDALQKVETARHHVELFRDQLVPQAWQAFEANQLSYETGKVGFLDWIGAQRSLRDIEALAREHRADYEAALAELEAVVGADLQIFPAVVRPMDRRSK